MTAGIPQSGGLQLSLYETRAIRHLISLTYVKRRPLSGTGELPNKREARQRQAQNEGEEDDGAVLEAPPGDGLHALQDPVGKHVTGNGRKGEIDSFHGAQGPNVRKICGLWCNPRVLGTLIQIND